MYEKAEDDQALAMCKVMPGFADETEAQADQEEPRGPFLALGAFDALPYLDDGLEAPSDREDPRSPLQVSGNVKGLRADGYAQPPALIDTSNREFASFLGAAESLSFARIAQSDAARSLVAELVGAILGREKETRRRQRGQAGMEALRDTLGRTVGGLFRNWSNSRASRVNLSPRAFTGSDVQHRQFSAVLAALVSLGLCNKVIGTNTKPPIDWGDGIFTKQAGLATRLWPTGGLLDLATSCGVSLTSLAGDFTRPKGFTGKAPVIGAPIRLTALRDPRRPNTLKNNLPLDLSLPPWLAIRDEVVATNAAAEAHEVTGCLPPRWARTFTSDAALGGRWYAQGDRDGTYQVMPQRERLSIRIDGEAVAEVDVSASYLSIMHGLLKLPLPEEDPYAIEVAPRDIVKQWMVASLGLGRPIRKWPAKALRDNPALAEHPAALVGEAIAARYEFMRAPAQAVAEPAGLAGLSSLGKPEKLLVHRLMAIEAKAMTTAMQALMMPMGVRSELVLPMHDGLIVPLRLARHAEETIKLAFRAVAAVNVRVKTDPPS